MKNLSKLVMIALLGSLLVVSGCKSELDDKPAAVTKDVKSAPASQPADKKSAVDKKPAADAKKAKGDANKAAGDMKKTAEVKAAPAKGKTFDADYTKSSIGWLGAKITGDHKGTFKKFTASATIDGNTLTALTYTVDTRTMHTDDSDKLLGHLKSPDFLNVEKFPTSTFLATTFSPITADGATHKVTGSLEMMGVKKEVTFPANIKVDDTGFTGKAEFKINRKDFGIVYKGKPDDLIKDEVLLSINIFAPKK